MHKDAKIDGEGNPVGPLSSNDDANFIHAGSVLWTDSTNIFLNKALPEHSSL